MSGGLTMNPMPVKTGIRQFVSKNNDEMSHFDKFCVILNYDLNQ